MKKDKAELTTPPPQPILLPKGQVGSAKQTVKDRQKHPRLVGADLYVARLGWCKDRTKRNPKAELSTGCCKTSFDISETLLDSAIRITLQHKDPDMDVTQPLPPTSLHDELTNPHPRSGSSAPSPTSPSSTNTHFDHSASHASRPCYRCVTYMHSVGIRRVFWTNELGEWESGKVRDLVDALDTGMAGEAGDHGTADGLGATGGPLGNGLFVTKHEVLMLRRIMGRKSG